MSELATIPATSNDVLAAVPQMMELARMLKGATGLIPEHLRTEGQILATILAGRELGLGPMASMRGLHVVKGKVGADYSLWVALLKRNGYRVEYPESSAERVTLKLTDPRGAVHVETWTKDRAAKAGLWNSGQGWQKYPETMLRARCVTSAGRAFAAEVMSGAYSLDEIDEIQGRAPQPEVVSLSASDRLARKVAAAAQPHGITVEVIPEPTPMAVEPIAEPAPAPQEAAPSMLPEEAIAAIDACATVEALNALVPVLKQFKGTDLKTVRSAWRDRKAEVLESLGLPEGV